MSRPTSVIDNPLVRQAPISGLLALGAVFTLLLPTLEVTNSGIFSASLVATAVATLLAAVALRFPRVLAFVPILLAVDFVSLALFRTGTGAGASVFTSLVVLPVVWWASLEGRRTIAYSIVGVTIVILAPYALSPGEPLRASELVRLGVTVVVFGAVAVIVHELSRRARRSVLSAEAREDKVLAEIDRAAAVQRSLLPTSTDDLGTAVTVAGACLPAKSVGGDFFDWYRTPTGVAVGLGDVMGKGVGAGLIAAAVRATIRSARTVDDASEALRRASDGLAAEGAGTDVTFTTLFHARIADDGTLQWADAGHGLSFIFRTAGGVERLRSVDLPLGMGLRDEWATTTGALEPGDLLISFSDGVLDLFGGRDDAIDSVAELARVDREPAAIVAALARRAAEVPHDDDVTVIAIRREPVLVEPAESAAAPVARSA
jgi:sigma-B regulation protein RsbU (phosphoserine phosphatase)